MKLRYLRDIPAGQPVHDQRAFLSILPDGNYEKQVTYAYHSGNTVVDFKLTVSGDVITSASAVGVNADPCVFLTEPHDHHLDPSRRSRRHLQNDRLSRASS